MLTDLYSSSRLRLQSYTPAYWPIFKIALGMAGVINHPPGFDMILFHLLGRVMHEIQFALHFQVPTRQVEPGHQMPLQKNEAEMCGLWLNSWLAHKTQTVISCILPSVERQAAPGIRNHHFPTPKEAPRAAKFPKGPDHLAFHFETLVPTLTSRIPLSKLLVAVSESQHIRERRAELRCV